MNFLKANPEVHIHKKFGTNSAASIAYDRIFHAPRMAPRILAHAVDSTLTISVSILPTTFQLGQFFATGEFSKTVLVPWSAVFGLPILMAAFEICCLKFLGASMGKLFMGLRVVNYHTGGDLTWMQAILRVVSRFLCIFLSWTPYAFSFFRFDRTHVLDWIAETQVKQLSPRKDCPKRRWVLGLVLIFVFLSSAFAGLREQAKLWKDSVFRLEGVIHTIR